MSLRNIEVVLKANVGQYVAGLDKASAATRGLHGELTASSDDGAAALDAISTKAGVAGLAMAAGFGLAIKTFADFDAQMSRLQAATEGTAAEMGALETAVIDAGAATVFSASEAAAATTELAKAGVSTADILAGGLTGALNLAAAGGLDLAYSAELAANAMTTFKLGGGAVPRIADALAAGANKSAADVGGMGESLAQAGLVADQFGLTLEDTVGVLSLFAQNGLKGSDAGTSLKTMLLRLGAPVDKSKRQMEELGLSFYDAEGRFVGIEAAAGQLQERLGHLTEEQRNAAMNIIFGTDAIRGASILYDSGAEGVAHWVDEVSDSGYAAEQAAIMTDNLKGDIESLSGAIETQLIGAGSKANGSLRDMVQGGEMLVNGFGALPPVFADVALGIGGITTAGLLGVGAVGKMLPAWRETRKALENAGTSGAFFARNMNTAVSALGAAGIVGGSTLAVWSAWVAEMREAEDLMQGFIENSKATSIDQSPEELLRMLDVVGSEIERLERDADATLNFVAGGKWREGADELKVYQGELYRLRGQMQILAGATGETEEATLAWLQSEAFNGRTYDSSRDALMAYTGQIEELGGSHVEAAESAEAQREAVEGLSDALKALTDPFFGMMVAQDNLTQAAWDLTEAQNEAAAAAKEHGWGSMEHEQALLRVEQATRDQVIAARDLEIASNDLAGAAMEQPGLWADAAAALDGWVEKGLITQAQADQMKTAFVEATARSQELGSQRPHVVATADTAGAEMNLERVREALARIAVAAKLVQSMEFVKRGLVMAASMPQASDYQGGYLNQQYYNPVYQTKEGRAGGGPTYPGRLYEVAERRTELLHEGGKSYLLPAKHGHVTPSLSEVSGKAGGGFGPLVDEQRAVDEGFHDLRRTMADSADTSRAMERALTAQAKAGEKAEGSLKRVAEEVSWFVAQVQGWTVYEDGSIAGQPGKRVAAAGMADALSAGVYGASGPSFVGTGFRYVSWAHAQSQGWTVAEDGSIYGQPGVKVDPRDMHEAFKAGAFSANGWGIYGAYAPRRARGGATRPGELYEVSEHRTELLYEGGRSYLLPARHGHVVPALTATGGAGGGQVQVSVSMPNYLGDPRDVVRLLASEVQERMRTEVIAYHGSRL